jgi:hypothetical protein
MYEAKITGVISSIKEQSSLSASWILFPNPAKSIVSVRTDKNSAGMTYSIFDNMGRAWLNGNLEAYETAIQIHSLPAGLYFIKAMDDDGNAKVFRFLVQE